MCAAGRPLRFRVFCERSPLTTTAAQPFFAAQRRPIAGLLGADGMSGLARNTLLGFAEIRRPRGETPFRRKDGTMLALGEVVRTAAER
jgi:hypothetical protein